MSKKLKDKSVKEICEDNGLTFQLMANVVEEKVTIGKIRATLEIIEKTLSRTLGPYGSTTIIQDREMKHFMTKDGYDVMNRIHFSDDAARTILDLVRKVSSEQVKEVGDGSTSSIICSTELYKHLTDKENKEGLLSTISPKDILSMLDSIYPLLEERIKDVATPISEDWKELETIATVSANNDKETGKMIKDLYDQVGEHGFITTDVIKPYEKDTIEKIQGIEWKRGATDNMYYQMHGSKENKIVYEQKPHLFISDERLSFDDVDFLSELLGRVCGKSAKELVIVAPGYEQDLDFFFKKNRYDNPGLNFVTVDIANLNQEWIERIHDIAAFAGSKIYSKVELNKIAQGDKLLITANAIAQLDDYLGMVDKVIISEGRTQIMGMKPPARAGVDERVASAKEKLAELELDTDENFQDIFYMKRRIASLEGSNVILHVGGRTLSERQTRERLIEDAILACKSTIKHGYIYGGNLIIPRILLRKGKHRDIVIKELAKTYSYLPVENVTKFAESFVDLLGNAFLQSYKYVLENSSLSDEKIKEILNTCVTEDKFYNLKLHKYESTEECSIINSTDTDIQILRSVISLIGSLAISNQMITLNNTRE